MITDSLKNIIKEQEKKHSDALKMLAVIKKKLKNDPELERHLDWLLFGLLIEKLK